MKAPVRSRRSVRFKQRALALLEIVAVLLLLSTGLFGRPVLARAETAVGYVLSWWTVDGGGVSNQGSGGYSLSGTAGQPDAVTWSGGDYSLTGGFWSGSSGAGEAFENLYLPVLLKGQ